MLLLVSACGGDDGPRVEVTTGTAPPEATSGVPLATTATPAIGALVVPVRPENLFAGGLLVGGYLEAGASGRGECLPAIVATWDLAPVRGERCASLDLDGDDIEEFLFVVAERAIEDAAAPGDVWIFGGEPDFKLAATARQLLNAVTSDPELVATVDLTGDGLDEAIARWQRCDAEPCTVGLLVVSGHRGRIQDIGPDDLELASLEGIDVRDADGDGLLDLVLRGASDTFAVEGALAGPTREGTRTLRWGGIRFFTSEQLEAPRYLIHAIEDADRLFASRDYPAARAAYEALAADPALLDWHAEVGLPADRLELVPYALMRAGIAAIRAGDEIGGLQLLEAAVRGHEFALLGLAAATYLGGITGGIGADQSCALAETVMQTRLEEWARVWDFGSANSMHSVADLCR